MLLAEFDLLPSARAAYGVLGVVTVRAPALREFRGVTTERPGEVGNLSDKSLRLQMLPDRSRYTRYLALPDRHDTSTVIWPVSAGT